MDKFSPLFIVGVGRSGTSLLQSMLHTHPNIVFLPETQFLRKHIFRNRLRKLRTEEDKKAFIDVLAADEKFRRAQVEPELIVGPSQNYPEVYQRFLQTFYREGLSYVGDKDPRFLDYLPYLKQLFPKAKIIHLIRDPRDVVLSRTKADWSKHWPFFMHGCMYQAQLKRGRANGKAAFGANYCELFYEDLIEQPETSLRVISDFLKLEYSATMLQFAESAKSLVDSKELQWKSETMGPLLSVNKGKWANAFTNYQIALIEKICAPVLKQLPYKPAARWDEISLGEKVQISGLRVFSEIFSLIYPLRIKWL